MNYASEALNDSFDTIVVQKTLELTSKKFCTEPPSPNWVLVQKSRPWNTATKGTGTNKQ
jgi:hypothetical protein